MIRCRDARERAQEILDTRGDLAADPELSRHTAQCGPCADYVRDLASLAALTARAATAPAPAIRADAIAERVRSTLERRVLQLPQRRPVWRPVLAYTASAAVVLLLGIQVGLRLRPATTPITAPITASAPAAPAPSAPMAPLVAAADTAPRALPSVESTPPAGVEVATAPPPVASTRPTARSSRPPIIPQGRSRVRRSTPSRSTPPSADLETVSAPAGRPSADVVPVRGSGRPSDEAGRMPIIVVVPGQGL